MISSTSRPSSPHIADFRTISAAIHHEMQCFFATTRGRRPITARGGFGRYLVRVKTGTSLLIPVRLLADMRVDKRVLSTRDIYEEADPEYEAACFLMGRITIEYAGEETGLLTVGFRITDPRGREIGYDPRTRRGWQELLLAQAFLDCEENEDTGELRAVKVTLRSAGQSAVPIRSY